MKTLPFSHQVAIPLRELQVAQRLTVTGGEQRPTRILRGAEEEAVFAYNRQARTQQGTPLPKVDVYV